MVKLIDKMSIRLKKLTVFSDGSLLLDTTIKNQKQKNVRCLEKDLKTFQKGYYEKSLNTLIKANATKVYRKRLFK